MENIVTAIFEVESEAYQAFSQLKQDMVNTSCVITQMALVKKQNGRIIPCEGYDTGLESTDDTWKGGLIGSLVGILGGPLGVLLGGSMGVLIGGAVDANDSGKNLSMIEKVSEKLADGEVALIALAKETSEVMLDARLGTFHTTILRHDAAVVAQEVEEARELQKELAKEAKRKMREAKKQEIEAKRAKLQADFEDFKKKFDK